jgi:hypothetical protein
MVMRRLNIAVRVLAVLGCTAFVAANPKDKPEKPVGKLVPLNKQETVLLDQDGKRLILKSEVVLREGLLEMLACLKQTKEHESILAVPTKAQMVHAGLLALGAEPGTPVKFTPEFQPPTGTKIEIFLSWTDEKGNTQRIPAQSWVRNATLRYFVEPLKTLPADVKLPKDKNLKYDEKRMELLWYGSMTKAERDMFLSQSNEAAWQKAIKSFFDRSQMREMKADWVFAGSGFFTDEKTGEKYYQAESGDLICVANFASSVLDVDAESSATNDGLLFEAYTERIPPIGTKVDIELRPVLKSAK